MVRARTNPDWFRDRGGERANRGRRPHIAHLRDERLHVMRKVARSAEPERVAVE
jgi:hypothetical protein